MSLFINLWWFSKALGFLFALKPTRGVLACVVHYCGWAPLKQIDTLLNDNLNVRVHEGMLYFKY